MVDFTTEAPVTLPSGMVSINFVATDGTNILSDAIVLTSEMFALWTAQDIENEKQRRWDNLLASFTFFPDTEVMSDG